MTDKEIVHIQLATALDNFWYYTLRRPFLLMVLEWGGRCQRSLRTQKFFLNETVESRHRRFRLMNIPERLWALGR